MQLHIIDREYIEYGDFLRLQHALIQSALDTHKDYLVVCSHNPVYTLGRQSQLADFRVDMEKLTIPLYSVQRGGRVAYHDPGQLMVYPIVDISRSFNKSAAAFTQYFKEGIQEVLGSISVRAEARDDGLWVDNAKTVFMGFGFWKWVSFHGFAINVTTDLTAYDSMRPCGKDITVQNLSSSNGQTKFSVIILKNKIIDYFMTNDKAINIY